MFYKLIEGSKQWKGITSISEKQEQSSRFPHMFISQLSTILVAKLHREKNFYRNRKILSFVSSNLKTFWENCVLILNKRDLFLNCDWPAKRMLYFSTFAIFTYIL